MMNRLVLVIAAVGVLLLGGCATPTADAVGFRGLIGAPQEMKTPTPTPTVEAIVETPPVVAIEAPAEEAPVEEAPVAEAPAGPVLCPPGTQSNGSDGYNDTSCFPDVCWTIPVPDPSHPECDYAYPPEYYY